MVSSYFAVSQIKEPHIVQYRHKYKGEYFIVIYHFGAFIILSNEWKRQWRFLNFGYECQYIGTKIIKSKVGYVPILKQGTT